MEPPLRLDSGTGKALTPLLSCYANFARARHSLASVARQDYAGLAYVRRLRGVDQNAALPVVAEIGDLLRFVSALQWPTSARCRASTQAATALAAARSQSSWPSRRRVVSLADFVRTDLSALP